MVALLREPVLPYGEYQKWAPRPSSRRLPNQSIEPNATTPWCIPFRVQSVEMLLKAILGNIVRNSDARECYGTASSSTGAGPELPCGR